MVPDGCMYHNPDLWLIHDRQHDDTGFHAQPFLQTAAKLMTYDDCNRFNYLF